MTNRAEAVVNLSAIKANVATLKAIAGVDLLAVVKADAYGHGLVPVAKAALDGGATWLGVALLEEAIALRTSGTVSYILLRTHETKATLVCRLLLEKKQIDFLIL